MEQINLFDYKLRDQDPLYHILSKVRKTETIYLGDFEIKLNQFGIYEISFGETHITKETLLDCYDYINQRCNRTDLFGIGG